MTAEDRLMCESVDRMPPKHLPQDISYDSDEPEDVEEIIESLMKLSELSLNDFLASEPDIYTDADLKILYR